MQATRSQPVADWSCPRTASTAGGSSQAAVRPRRARRTEWGGRPVACRPTRPGGLEVVLPTEVPRGGCGDTAIHQDELEPAGDALLGRVLQHQVAGPVLVGRGRNHQRGHRKAGDVDGHDTLRALRAAVGDASPGRPHRKAPDRPSGRGPCVDRGRNAWSGRGEDPEGGQPVLDDLDVDSLVAAEVAAVVGVGVAGDGDDVAVEERRATRVAEAGAAGATVVVDVAVELEDLVGELLARLDGVRAGSAGRSRGRLLRA